MMFARYTMPCSPSDLVSLNCVSVSMFCLMYLEYLNSSMLVSSVIIPFSRSILFPSPWNVIILVPFVFFTSDFNFSTVDTLKARKSFFFSSEMKRRQFSMVVVFAEPAAAVITIFPTPCSISLKIAF